MIKIFVSQPLKEVKHCENKILLGMTLLSAFILAACGKWQKRAIETTAAPTTTTQTTTWLLWGKRNIPCRYQRNGNEKFGYINILKIGSYALLEVAKRSNIYHQTKTMR